MMHQEVNWRWSMEQGSRAHIYVLRRERAVEKIDGKVEQREERGTE